MTDSYEIFLEETDEIEPFTAEWFKILAKHSSRLLEYEDFSTDLQEQLEESINVNSFGTVKVGATDVVAEIPADTLTLSAGSNITLSANATTDTITISATGGGTVSDAFDFGTFASPADFTLDFGTY